MSRYITIPEDEYGHLKKNSERWSEYVQKKHDENEVIYTANETLMVITGEKAVMDKVSEFNQNQQSLFNEINHLKSRNYELNDELYKMRSRNLIQRILNW